MKIILSISGGGIRGLIPAIILEEIEKRTNKRIADSVDLIAGNSTGGIIACLLSVPDEYCSSKYSAKDIVRMYKNFGKQVFKRSIFKKIVTINGLLKTKYSEKKLENLLKEYFGCTTLNKTCTNIIIPTYQVSSIPFPMFFKTRHAQKSLKSKENPRLWECARATSAASSYFRPYYYDSSTTYIDGGIFANNPSLCAYIEAKKHWKNEKIILISLGTGEKNKGLDYNKIKNWGLIQWAVPYFEQTSLSADNTIDYMLKNLSEINGDVYYFIQTELDDKSLKLDDASTENIKRLEKTTKTLIERNSDIIDEICKYMLI